MGLRFHCLPGARPRLLSALAPAAAARATSILETTIPVTDHARLALMTYHADASRAESEVLPTRRFQPYPARSKNAQNMRVRKQSDRTPVPSRPARGRSRRRLAPPRARPSLHLSAGWSKHSTAVRTAPASVRSIFPFSLSVVPLAQPLIDLRQAAEARNLASPRAHAATGSQVPSQTLYPSGNRAALQLAHVHALSGRYPCGLYGAPLKLHAVSPCRTSHSSTSSAIALLRPG